MPPIKVRLNLTFGLGGDVLWKISRWPPWPSSFSAIRLAVWEEMLLEEFQDGHHGGQLGYGNGTILAILNLCVTVMPPIKFQLNQTSSLGGDVVWRISRWPPWHLRYRNEMILVILNLHVATMPPTKFQLNPTYGSGKDVENVKS